MHFLWAGFPQADRIALTGEVSGFPRLNRRPYGRGHGARRARRLRWRSPRSLEFPSSFYPSPIRSPKQAAPAALPIGLFCEARGFTAEFGQQNDAIWYAGGGPWETGRSYSTMAKKAVKKVIATQQARSGRPVRLGMSEATHKRMERLATERGLSKAPTLAWPFSSR